MSRIDDIPDDKMPSDMELREWSHKRPDEPSEDYLNSEAEEVVLSDKQLFNELISTDPDAFSWLLTRTYDDYFTIDQFKKELIEIIRECREQ